jgi:hypothetical protein
MGVSANFGLQFLQANLPIKVLAIGIGLIPFIAAVKMAHVKLRRQQALLQISDLFVCTYSVMLIVKSQPLRTSETFGHISIVRAGGAPQYPRYVLVNASMLNNTETWVKYDIECAHICIRK